MLGITHNGQAKAEVLTLEAHAKYAGAALACVYSSSAELDAALIDQIIRKAMTASPAVIPSRVASFCFR